MKALFWLPRILAFLFAIFLGLFSLDTPFGIGLLMHLLPSFIIITVTLALWKFDLPAGIVFIGLGIVATLFFNTFYHPLTFLMISGPFFLIGILYVVGYMKSQPKRSQAVMH